MAEALMNAANLPPQQPPGTSMTAGDGGSAGLPMASNNAGANSGTQLPGAIAGVVLTVGGIVLLRDKTGAH